MSRTYTQDEVREIIRRAAETTAKKQRSESEDSGLSIEDLKDLAVSTGLDPEVMLAAARSLDRDVEESFEKRVLGVKISAAHAVRVEGRLSDEEWQSLVADCRSTFAARGRVHDQAGLREWSNGNLHVLVEPAGEDSIIRMRTHKGQAQSIVAGGVAMALSFTAAILSTYAGGGAADNLLPLVMIIVALTAGAGVFSRKRVGDWSQTRESQMADIGRRVEQRRTHAEEQAPSLGTTQNEQIEQIENTPAERIELPDSDQEDVESVRLRNRER